MNKRLLIKIIVIILTVAAVVSAWLLISFWNAKTDNQNQTNSTKQSDQYPTARDAADWNAPFMKKIEVIYMDKAEKTALGLADNQMVRLQVLERDAAGKVTAYKKVSRDEDIIQYVYDPSGAVSGTVTVIPADATTTKTLNN